MRDTAQNENRDTAQNEIRPMRHRNHKTGWRSHKTLKIQLIPAVSGAFSVWTRVKWQLRMLLAKPVWKPRGNEDSEDLTDFHLDAF